MLIEYGLQYGRPNATAQCSWGYTLLRIENVFHTLAVEHRIHWKQIGGAQTQMPSRTLFSDNERSRDPHAVERCTWSFTFLQLCRMRLMQRLR